MMTTLGVMTLIAHSIGEEWAPEPVAYLIFSGLEVGQ